MTRWMIAILVGLLVAWAVIATGAEQPTLTEVQRLKVQLQQAQEQLLQAQYQLATCTAQAEAVKLTQARQALDREVTVEGYTFDWQTLTFKPKEEKRP